MCEVIYGVKLGFGENKISMQTYNSYPGRIFTKSMKNDEELLKLANVHTIVNAKEAKIVKCKNMLLLKFVTRI